MLNLFQHLTTYVYNMQGAYLSVGCRNKFGMT